MKYYLSVCSVFKWEWYWLKEWIDYHCRLGVEHFYLVGNESGEEEKKSKDVLAPYVDSGVVDLLFDNRAGLQLDVYNNTLLNQCRANSRWAAFIDIDEFIVPMKNENIPDFLRLYEDYSALAVNWWLFGSSGLIERPKSILDFKMKNKLPSNHVKLIVNPALVLEFINPHFACYTGGSPPPVNENFTQVFSHESDFPSTEKIRINHYYVKSRQDFELKMKRGRATIANLHRDNSMWLNSQDEDNDLFDDYIKKFFL